jgi:hypothetical protein
MRVMFCDFDGGDVLYEMERNDIAELLAVVHSKNAKTIIQHSEDDFFYGTIEESTFEMMIDEETGERVEYLKLFFTRAMRQITLKNTLQDRLLHKVNT